MYNDLELSNKTEKIICEEQSVNTPTIKTIISNDVDDKIKTIHNKLTALQKKHKDALSNLAKI